MILALAALLHGTNDAVRRTAKRLVPYVSSSTAKRFMKPMADSTSAYDIVMGEIVYPTSEDVVGTLFLNGYEYDIVVTYRDELECCVDEMTYLTADRLLARGILTGRAYMTFKLGYGLKDYQTSVLMDDYARRSIRSMCNGGNDGSEDNLHYGQA